MLALAHHSKVSTHQNSDPSTKGQPAITHDWFTGLFIKKEHPAVVENSTIENTGFIKRITPFLLFSTFLMGFFPYLIITNQSTAQNGLLLTILFPFTVGSIFYFDNFLWNYYQGKKLGLIWIIEVAIASFFLALSFLI